MTLNKVMLIGNVGGDPQIRSLGEDREVATFSLATTETWKDRNTGERKERTEWHRVVVFSQGLVGIIKNHVKKGSKLYLEGQLQTRKWADNSGIEKYTTEVVLQNFNSILYMLDSRNKDDSSQRFQENSGGGNTSSSSQEPPVIDDDVPF